MEDRIREALEESRPFSVLSEEDKDFIVKITTETAEEQIQSSTDHNRVMGIYDHEQTVQETQN